MEELLKVTETFLIAGRGLLLQPALPWPGSGSFKTFRARVEIQTPAGASTELDAVFTAEHLSLVGGRSRWDIAVVLPDATKQQVPVGSVVRTTPESIRALQGRT